MDINEAIFVDEDYYPVIPLLEEIVMKRLEVNHGPTNPSSIAHPGVQNSFRDRFRADRIAAKNASQVESSRKDQANAIVKNYLKQVSTVNGQSNLEFWRDNTSDTVIFFIRKTFSKKINFLLLSF